MKHVKSRQEIVDHFHKCKNALIASCAGYDDGSLWEAERLATSTYIMVHDGGRNSKSILSHLGLRAGLRIPSHARPINRDNLLPQNPLTLMRFVVGQGADVVPALDNGPHQPVLRQVQTWWEKEPVFSHGQVALNRRGLVFSLRSQDGGAHVDAELTNEDYIAMKLKAPKWKYLAGPQEEPQEIIGEELATMRHVAFELMTALNALGRIA